MHVYIHGSGELTFVMLPGYVTTYPKDDFKLLTEELSKKGRVAVVDPFGH